MVSISGKHSLANLSPSWIQAHGHAQVFGWIGTFIIGIGYYSLSKMGRVRPFAASRGWASWILWTGGVALRWIGNISEWNWQVLLPASASLQLVAFVIFFATVSRHKPRHNSRSSRGINTWMTLVMVSTGAFLLALVMNLELSISVARYGAHPEVPHWADQRYLFLAACGFPVLAVWGLNARWLPVFLGLSKPADTSLLAALAVDGCGIGAALLGSFIPATVLLLCASILATFALRVFRSRSDFSAPWCSPSVSGSFPRSAECA